MIWSRYNIFFQKEGKNFLYNSLSNSFARLEEECYRRLEESFRRDAYPEEDKDIVPDLRNMKAIDVDDQTELLRIRHLEQASKFNPSSLDLTINPTLSCNFRCPYCFEKDHPVKFMSDEVEDSIVEMVTNNRLARRVFVTWFGGEPLLAFKRMKSLSRRLIETGKEYSAGMITNGYLLDEKVAEELKELRIRMMQITIDGDKETHDSRRFLAGGGPTYDTIMNNIIKCQEISPEVTISIRVNVDSTNRDNFIRFHEYFRSLNLPNANIYPGFVSDKDGEEGSDCSLCGKSEATEFLVSLYKDYGLRFIDLFPTINYSACTAGRVNGIVIGPEGELYKCWNDVGNSEKVYGFLNKPVGNRKVLYRYLEGGSRFDNEKCKGCQLLPVCSGGCLYTRLRNKYEKADVDFCPVYKDNLEDFLYLHYISKTT